jgi:hypothetical protein
VANHTGYRLPVNIWNACGLVPTPQYSSNDGPWVRRSKVQTFFGVAVGKVLWKGVMFSMRGRKAFAKNQDVWKRLNNKERADIYHLLQGFWLSIRAIRAGICGGNPPIHRHGVNPLVGVWWRTLTNVLHCGLESAMKDWKKSGEHLTGLYCRGSSLGVVCGSSRFVRAMACSLPSKVEDSSGDEIIMFCARIAATLPSPRGEKADRRAFAKHKARVTQVKAPLPADVNKRWLEFCYNFGKSCAGRLAARRGWDDLRNPLNLGPGSDMNTPRSQGGTSRSCYAWWHDDEAIHRHTRVITQRMMRTPNWSDLPHDLFSAITFERAVLSYAREQIVPAYTEEVDPELARMTGRRDLWPQRSIVSVSEADTPVILWSASKVTLFTSTLVRKVKTGRYGPMVRGNPQSEVLDLSADSNWRRIPGIGLVRVPRCRAGLVRERGWKYRVTTSHDPLLTQVSKEINSVLLSKLSTLPELTHVLRGDKKAAVLHVVGDSTYGKATSADLSSATDEFEQETQRQGGEAVLQGMSYGSTKECVLMSHLMLGNQFISYPDGESVISTCGVMMGGLFTWPMLNLTHLFWCREAERLAEEEQNIKASLCGDDLLAFFTDRQSKYYHDYAKKFGAVFSGEHKHIQSRRGGIFCGMAFRLKEGYGRAPRRYLTVSSKAFPIRPITFDHFAVSPPMKGLVVSGSLEGSVRGGDMLPTFIRMPSAMEALEDMGYDKQMLRACCLAVEPGIETRFKKRGIPSLPRFLGGNGFDRGAHSLIRDAGASLNHRRIIGNLLTSAEEDRGIFTQKWAGAVSRSTRRLLKKANALVDEGFKAGRLMPAAEGGGGLGRTIYLSRQELAPSLLGVLKSSEIAALGPPRGKATKPIALGDLIRDLRKARTKLSIQSLWAAPSNLRTLGDIAVDWYNQDTVTSFREEGEDDGSTDEHSEFLPFRTLPTAHIGTFGNALG